MLLQEFFFKSALEEVGVLINQPYLIDHKMGRNINAGKSYPLTFPNYILNYINKISKEKLYEYNFIGSITEKRTWVKKYNNNSIVQYSDTGRDPKIKYDIDKNYYNIMSKSKFTLCPTGDCPWSYRFFEAIMCHSIPIVEDNSNDIFKDEYIYFYNNQSHTFTTDVANYNYQKFISSNHFLNNIDFTL